MAAILWLAADGGSPERTSRWVLPVLRFVFPAASATQLEAMHGLVRKAAHLTEYAILAGLWIGALTPPRPRTWAAWRAWAITVGWAVVDESFQTMTPSRTGSAWDVALDAGGALLVAWPAGVGWRYAAELVTRVALWTATVGGIALIAFNAATGVASGVLWITVPVALALVVLRRRARP